VANACLETSALFPEDKKTGVVVELKRRSHPVELSIVLIGMIAVELRQSHVDLSERTPRINFAHHRSQQNKP
jgi:hypothetical protein